jgi:hypothetical protein
VRWIDDAVTVEHFYCAHKSFKTNITFFAFVILTKFDLDVFEVVKPNQLNLKFYSWQHKSTVVRTVTVVHHLVQSDIS